MGIYLRGKTIPDADKLFEMCFKLKLHPIIIYDLVEKAGYSMNTIMCNQPYFHYLINSRYSDGVENVKKYIELLE